MTRLDGWLIQAVRCLSKDSADLVRREIHEHYDAAREAAMNNGADPQQADFVALQALGDPGIANRQYRKVLLTASEAVLLKQSNHEARMICSNSWLKWAFLSAPGTVLLLSAIFLAVHKVEIARGALMLGALMAVLHLAPFLPIYTPARGQVYRISKWTLMIGGTIAMFWGSAWNSSWLIACCFFPIFLTEWKRIMIRRKLPIAQWPKQLFL